MADIDRFDDESPQPFVSRDFDQVLEHFDLKKTPLWQNVAVEEKKIARRGFEYSRSRLVNGAGTTRKLYATVFDFYLWTGEWWNLNVGIGNRWVARLGFEFSKKERVSLRLDLLRLFDIEINLWWPGA